MESTAGVCGPATKARVAAAAGDATTASCITSTERAAYRTASHICRTANRSAGAPIEAWPSAVIPAASVEPASIVSAPAPRTDADKQAAVEPLRTVVTIRRAGVRIIIIVTVSACRWAHIRRPAHIRSEARSAEANAYGNALCVCV